MRLLVVSLLLLTGCSLVLPQINVSKSGFDGATTVSTDHAYVYGSSSNMGIAFYKNTNMPKNEAVIDIRVGSGTISSGNSLHLKFGNEFLDYKSIDETSENYMTGGYFVGNLYIQSATWSSKRYVVDMSIIERLAAEPVSLVRVDKGRSFEEGSLSANQPDSGKAIAKKFHEAVRANIK